MLGLKHEQKTFARLTPLLSCFNSLMNHTIKSQHLILISSQGSASFFSIKKYFIPLLYSLLII